MIEGMAGFDDGGAYEDGPLTEGHEGFSGAAGAAPLDREIWCAAAWEERQPGA